MSAHGTFVEHDLLGAYPALWLLFVLVLTVLGVVAHASFAFLDLPDATDPRAGPVAPRFPWPRRAFHDAVEPAGASVRR